MRPIGLNNRQYAEACRIADMPEGPAKERAKQDWRKRHDKKWPQALFRGNPDARDYREQSDRPSNVVLFPGRYLIDGLA